MPEIFAQVKRDVKKITGKKRAGLSLGLVEMGMYQGGFVGGMHFSPGTDIVMNKTPLKILLQQQPYEIIWAYTYHILLHEYIHSLGALDEQHCRVITLKISEAIYLSLCVFLIFKLFNFFTTSIKQRTSASQ